MRAQLGICLQRRRGTRTAAWPGLDKKTWLFCNVFAGLSRTANGGASWQKVNDSVVSCNYYSPSVVRASTGKYYLPTASGIIESADTITWSLLANSGGPHTTLVTTGSHLLAGNQWSLGYYSAAESGPTTWSTLPQPAAPSGQGATFLAYDAAHGLLYSSNFNGGLWQLAVR